MVNISSFQLDVKTITPTEDKYSRNKIQALLLSTILSPCVEAYSSRHKKSTDYASRAPLQIINRPSIATCSIHAYVRLV